MICTLLIALLLRSSSPEVITPNYDHIFSAVSVFAADKLVDFFWVNHRKPGFFFLLTLYLCLCIQYRISYSLFFSFL